MHAQQSLNTLYPRVRPAPQIAFLIRRFAGKREANKPGQGQSAARSSLSKKLVFSSFPWSLGILLFRSLTRSAYRDVLHHREPPDRHPTSCTYVYPRSKLPEWPAASWKTLSAFPVLPEVIMCTFSPSSSASLAPRCTHSWLPPS